MEKKQRGLEVSCHKHLVSLEIVIFGTTEYEAKHVAKLRWKHCPVCTLVKLSLIVHSPSYTEIYNNSYIITSHRLFSTVESNVFRGEEGAVRSHENFFLSFIFPFSLFPQRQKSFLYNCCM